MQLYTSGLVQVDHGHSSLHITMLRSQIQITLGGLFVCHRMAHGLQWGIRTTQTVHLDPVIEGHGYFLLVRGIP
jgi:hypothetical protein